MKSRIKLIIKFESIENNMIEAEIKPKTENIDKANEDFISYLKISYDEFRKKFKHLVSDAGLYTRRYADKYVVNLDFIPDEEIIRLSCSIREFNEILQELVKLAELYKENSVDFKIKFFGERIKRL